MATSRSKLLSAHRGVRYPRAYVQTLRAHETWTRTGDDAAWFRFIITLACANYEDDLEKFRKARRDGIGICCGATCLDECVFGTDDPVCFYYVEDDGE